MTLYEIDEQLMGLVDPETGEVLDREAFDRLAIERDRKIEGVALWIKNERAMSEALDAEIKNLQKRKKACDNRVDRLKDYLKYALEGEKFKTARASVSFRVGSVTKIADEKVFIEWAQKNHREDLLRIAEPEISKTNVAKALDNGENIPGVSIEQTQSVIIK